MDLRATYNRIAEDWHWDHQSDDWWIAGTKERQCAERGGFEKRLFLEGTA